MDEQTTVLVPLRVLRPELDRACPEQRLEALLGQHAEPTLGLALRVADLSGVDAEQPVVLGAHMHRVTVDHRYRADRRQGCDNRVGTYSEHIIL